MNCKFCYRKMFCRTPAAEYCEEEHSSNPSHMYKVWYSENDKNAIETEIFDVIDIDNRAYWMMVSRINNRVDIGVYYNSNWLIYKSLYGLYLAFEFADMKEYLDKMKKLVILL